MHQGYWGEEKTLDVLDRFSRFGLPLHFTETTLVSGHLMPAEIVDLNDYQVAEWPTTPEGEARQADEVDAPLLDAARRTRRSRRSPGGACPTAAGSARRPGSSAPTARPSPPTSALHGLIKGEWWLPPTTLRTDDAGRVRLDGFLGDYEVTSRGRMAGFALEPPVPSRRSRPSNR